MLPIVQRAVAWAVLAALLLFICAVSILALTEAYSRRYLEKPGDADRYSLEPGLVTTFPTDFVSHVPQMVGPRRFRGSIPTEAVQYPEGYDIQVNKFGFFTDFPVDAFPPKEANEFRIVLVGASGAQGHGARTNADMFYSLVQKQLNERMSPQIKIRIINLAQAGTEIRRNLEVLRGYAHPLQPDMILTYSGLVDISGPMSSGAFVKFSIPSGVEGENSSYPWYLNWLVKLFPRTMLKHGIGPKLRDLFDENRYRLRPSYNFPIQANLGFVDPPPEMHKTDPRRLYYNYIVPNMLNSFKAIKREFCGIPIVVVRSITGLPELTNDTLEKQYGIVGKLDGRFIDEWWRLAREKLPGYVNNRWEFLDAQEEIWSGWDLNKSSVTIDGITTPITWHTFSSHLDNLGHQLFTQWLVPRLEPIVRHAYSHRPSDPCEEFFRDPT